MSKRVICLVSPAVGIIIGSACATAAQARILASDRKANGKAFEDERVWRVNAALYYAKCHGERRRSVA